MNDAEKVAAAVALIATARNLLASTRRGAVGALGVALLETVGAGLSQRADEREVMRIGKVIADAIRRDDYARNAQ